MKTGIELIAEERQEQIEKHGRSLDKDTTINKYFELLKAANGLLYSPSELSPMSIIIDMGGLNGWDKTILAKMDAKPYKERLIIAGALIAAEIDRINSLT